jgi:hypothetical protein
MIDIPGIARRSLVAVIAALAFVAAGCSSPGPVECIVIDEASAAEAVASDNCENVRIQGGPFTDLTAFANLRPEVKLIVEEAVALQTTSGLPFLREVYVGVGLPLPSLTEVVLTADHPSVFGLGAASIASITLTYPPFVPAPGGGVRGLNLHGPLASPVSLVFEDQYPIYLVELSEVDFAIDAAPSLPHVERLQWTSTVPADLSVLQQFGRPSVYANFSLMPEEAYPILADYVAWLREEAPDTEVAVGDENGDPLELSDIGVP